MSPIPACNRIFCVVIAGPELLGMAAGLLALIALLIFLSAVLTARRAQRAAYYSTRRQLNETANRRLGASLIVLLVAGLVWLTSLLLPRPPAATLATAAPPTRPAIPTATATASPTMAPTPTPTVLPPTATIDPSPTPKATPIPEPTSSLLDSPSPAVPTPAQAAPDERLALLAIASGIGADGAPVGVTTSFSTEAKSIYIFFTYQDVPPSALLRHAWFKNGGSVFFGSKRLPARGRGQDHIFWSPSERLQPGLYEVRVSLGGVLQFVANFEVKQD
jgi:hypothetical protein